MRINKDKDEQAVVVRMPTELATAIKEKAAAEERSMSQAIRHTMRVWVHDEAPATATAG